MKIFYTPSLLLESFKTFVGVFLNKFRNFSHLMILDGFNPRKYFMGYTVITWSVFCCFVIKPSRYRLCKQVVSAAARRSAALSHR